MKSHVMSGKATYFKYLLSYLIIFAFFLIAYSLIIKKQISARFFEKYCEQIQAELEGITQQFNSDFVALSQIDKSIRQNPILSDYRHSSENADYYRAIQELRVYDISSPAISAIVYAKDAGNANVLSTALTVEYEENVFAIINERRQIVTFDPTPYLGASGGQLLMVSNEGASYCIYFPPTGFKANYIFFYVLDMNHIQQRLNHSISEEMVTVNLVDQQKEIIAGVNSSQAGPYLENLQFQDGIYKTDRDTSVCVTTGAYGKFLLMAVISNRAVAAQVEKAFADSYVILFLLGAVGLILVYAGMKSTFFPLRNLVRKIEPSAPADSNYLTQLGNTFSSMKETNQLLRDKLEDYRIFLQKSLLSSIVSSQQLQESGLSSEIDSLFRPDCSRNLFILYMASPGGEFPRDRILLNLRGTLSGKDSCMMLNSSPASGLFLVNCAETDGKTAERIKSFLSEHYRRDGYFSAVSSVSDSPLDIPSLYEEAMCASESWPKDPIVNYPSLPGESRHKFHYPYQELDRLSEELKEYDFSAARKRIERLFEITDQAAAEKTNIPDFFVCCVLLEILSIITGNMRQEDIASDLFKGVYLDTLGLCRSGISSNVRVQIYDNIREMVDYFEQVAGKNINEVQIKKFLEEFYCQPDFSITRLADKFQVSVGYMSAAFKNIMKENFSDYLWGMRLEKAKTLLKTTDLTVNQIGIRVGYLNDTSFRRRFKQKTGETPSAYRGKNKPGGGDSFTP